MATSIYYIGRGKRNYAAIEDKGDYYEVRYVSNGGLYTSNRRDVKSALEYIADMMGVGAFREDYDEIIDAAKSKMRHGAGAKLF